MNPKYKEIAANSRPVAEIVAEKNRFICQYKGRKLLTQYDLRPELFPKVTGVNEKLKTKPKKASI